MIARLLLALLLLCGPGASVLPASEGSPVPLAMWVWDARHITALSARDQLLAFCRTQQITTLYVTAYQLPPDDAALYRAFLRTAHHQGLRVHALAGDPRWALTRYHHLPLAWAEAILAFNQAGRPEERFDGLHTDIEPYLLTKAWSEHPAQLLGGLLNLHAKIADRVVDHRPLQLGVDVPFWFDDDPAYLIEWHGKVKAPSHHLLDVADYATVMDYRNYAEGADGAVALATQELDYADQVGKVVVIGQETQSDLFPAYITYGGKPAAYWWGEVAKLAAAFRGRKSFGGVAVHHYDSYRKLVG